eukprot:TRINITY_DN6271_c0_g1_i2.p1 TRINITY_DN6271_c0_g1~~TRINITY_DN6271_c0_g1_i2.p1  ORF type:complete len:397 (-),score=68.84 TRINITY_DN6271_c0_g1_i2:16-1050(-)
MKEVRVENNKETSVMRGYDVPDGDLETAFTINGETLATQYETFEYAVRTYNTKFGCLGTRQNLEGGKFGKYEWKNYVEVAKLRTLFGNGLRNLGVKAGDKVGIYSKNREEWIIAEQACYENSFVIVSFYDTLGPDAVKFIANHCEAKIVICSNESLPHLIKVIDKCKFIETIVLTDPLPPEDELDDEIVDNLHKFKYFYSVLDDGNRTSGKAVNPKPSDLSTSQIWVYGDSNERYLVCIVFPNEKVLGGWAKKNGLWNSGETFEDIFGKKAVREEVLRALNETGKKAEVRGFERLASVCLFNAEFGVENDLATPTLKLKRHNMKLRFKTELSAMYDEIHDKYHK